MGRSESRSTGLHGKKTGNRAIFTGSKKVPHISQGSVVSYKDMMGLLILSQITAECYCERIFLNVSLHFGEVSTY